VTRAGLLTYEDYAAMPDDGRRYELHEGQLVMTPAPGTEHQRVSANLFVALRQHAHARGLGEVLYAPLDVILSNITVVQPDIVFVAFNRVDVVSRRGIEGAPTLAIEILSPSTRTIDLRTKHRLYAGHGVPFFWLVDPDRRAIEAYVLEHGAYRRSAVATGSEPVDLPPFSGLALVPTSLWP